MWWSGGGEWVRRGCLEGRRRVSRVAGWRGVMACLGWALVPGRTAAGGERARGRFRADAGASAHADKLLAAHESLLVIDGLPLALQLERYL